MARASKRVGFGGTKPNVVLSDCSTLTGVTISVGTGGSVTFDDSTRSPRAAGSIKMVQPTISSSFVQFTQNVSPVVSPLLATGIGVWVLVKESEAGGLPVNVTFGVYFGSTPGDTTGGFATLLGSFSGARNGYWYFISADKLQCTYGGGASATSWSTLSITRIIVQRYGVASEIPFWIGGVELTYPARPKLVLSFDGQYASQRDYIFPLMAARRLRGTMFITAEDVGGAGRMTAAEIVTWLGNGFDVSPRKYAAGGLGYDSTAYQTIASIVSDIKSAQAYCRSLGATDLMTKIQGIPQTNPWSGGNALAIRARCESAFVEAGVVLARMGSTVPSGFGNGMSTNQIPETLVDGHSSFVFARNLHNTETPANALAEIDQTIRLGAVMCHYMHETAAAGSTGVWSEANATTYMDGVALRVRQGLLDVITFSELVAGFTDLRG